MKNEKKNRRRIRQEYLQLHDFEGYYRDGELRLWIDYLDPYAYQCFGVESFCSGFRFLIKYDENGDMVDVRVSYYDGCTLRSVCRYWYFYKSELQELSELPISFGFDEKGCDERWNDILEYRFRQENSRFISIDEEY